MLAAIRHVPEDDAVIVAVAELSDRAQLVAVPPELMA